MAEVRTQVGTLSKSILRRLGPTSSGAEARWTRSRVRLFDLDPVDLVFGELPGPGRNLVGQLGAPALGGGQLDPLFRLIDSVGTLANGRGQLAQLFAERVGPAQRSPDPAVEILTVPKPPLSHPRKEIVGSHAGILHPVDGAS